MFDYSTPGVYWETDFPLPVTGLLTGVPVFLGYAGAKVPDESEGEASQVAVNEPKLLTSHVQYEQYFADPSQPGYLAHAVRGFFENGGRRCYVVRLEEGKAVGEALDDGLASLDCLDAVDLVCAPDIFARSHGYNYTDRYRLQQRVLDHCSACGDRMAILDSDPGDKFSGASQGQKEELIDVVKAQRGKLDGMNGALYFPWLDVGLLDGQGSPIYQPPCGHVAGIFARSDIRAGVHKAPANEALNGVLDLAVQLTEADQGDLNKQSINCLRAFRGRGIRVWGARTLSRDANWRYVNVRRLFLTVYRWLERNMAGVVFEPNEAMLWAGVERDLAVYFEELYRQGALKGASPREAFFVKCDGETNPEDVRDSGELVTDIGLAPAVPNEFIVVRITHTDGGIAVGEAVG